MSSNLIWVIRRMLILLDLKPIMVLKKARKTGEVQKMTNKDKSKGLGTKVKKKI